MPRFQEILFPVDFSELTRAAAPFVLSMAHRYQARVTAIHVLQPPPPIYAGINTVYPETFDFQGVRDDVRVQLRQFSDQYLPKVDVHCVVESGDPAAVICEYSSTHPTDLIAIPTHGYGTFRRALLGSVTAKVLHDSPIPVWTAAHAPEPSHRAHPQPRHIVCALDLKPESRQTLETAIQVAADTGADVEILHVVPETGVTPESAERNLQNLVVQAASHELVKIREGVCDECEVSVADGSVSSMVRNLALRKRADLVVIGRGLIQTGFGRLRANSYAIIRESPCPVLSV